MANTESLVEGVGLVAKKVWDYETAEAKPQPVDPEYLKHICRFQLWADCCAALGIGSAFIFRSGISQFEALLPFLPQLSSSNKDLLAAALAMTASFFLYRQGCDELHHQLVALQHNRIASRRKLPLGD